MQLLNILRLIRLISFSRCFSRCFSVKQDMEFPAGTPRLYRSYTFIDDHEQKEAVLNFAVQQPFYGGHRLVFAATSLQPSPAPSLPVIVKLVFGRYGDDVHRLLAQKSLAPKLYGCKEVEGAPIGHHCSRYCQSRKKALASGTSQNGRNLFGSH